MPCDSKAFAETVKSTSVKNIIAEARQLLANGDTNGYAAAKRKLPAFCFMATFDDNTGREGKNPPAAWRIQAAARLNGLVMLDFDHLEEDPREIFRKIPSHWFNPNSCPNAIMLAHVTPSGKGLRLVCVADPNRGNLADNQAYIALCLKMENDKAVKDASRTSFACSEDDILFINNDIFSYHSEEFNQRYGALYRSGVSSKTPKNTQASETPAGEVRTESSVGEFPHTFKGKPYADIAREWLRQNGTPAVGERHSTLLRLAGDLRYICDNKPQFLLQVVSDLDFVKAMLSEGAESAHEVEALCLDVCTRRMYFKKPERLEKVLNAAVPNWRKNTIENGKKDEEETGVDAGVYQEMWNRLRPLLSPPYDVACLRVDDANKLGAVFAAGTMYCTLMTRCYYTHFDGERQRMNPQAMIIGDPASGKSFADRLDRAIMTAMRAADAPGRQMIKDYKRETRKRENSSKEAKKAPLEKPEACIRYLPSRTSNAVFYERASNAKENIDGEPFPLHLYTFDSELDSNVTAQGGGAWISKHDIELKAFHNELSGVDYANQESMNDLIPVHYNTVVTGTPVSLNKKVNIRNVNDGLCSRLAIFRMLPKKYQMLNTGYYDIHKQTQDLRQWGFRFDSMKGELKIKPLVDHCYKLCEQAAFEAEAQGDDVLDYLRKRAVFYATWFTVPRIYGRQWDKYEKGEEIEVNDEDLEFATLIYDSVIYWQDFYFGNMLQESWENARQLEKPRRRPGKTQQVFMLLPNDFCIDDVMKYASSSRNAAKVMIYRWIKEGVIESMASKSGCYTKMLTQHDQRETV